MEKKKLNFLKKFIVVFIASLVLIASVVFFFTYISTTQSNIQNASRQTEDDLRSFHIIITGTYENQQFLEQVYLGALRYADTYQAVVELYVPKSQAESVSLQELLDYCSYVNADGIIAYIDSPEEVAHPKAGSFEKDIPIVTTGIFTSNIPQISFIGNSYWELGKRIADETLYYLPDGGNVYIITAPLAINSNFSNLLNSLQSTLMAHDNIKTDVLPSITAETELPDDNNLFICLNDEDTIQTAQLLADLYADKKHELIGFANNEVCQLYLKKGLINELIFLDPQKIGEAAIVELFEYKGKGYANSYIAADVQISRAKR